MYNLIGQVVYGINQNIFNHYFTTSIVSRGFHQLPTSNEVSCDCILITLFEDIGDYSPTSIIIEDTSYRWLNNKDRSSHSYNTSDLKQLLPLYLNLRLH